MRFIINFSNGGKNNSQWSDMFIHYLKLEPKSFKLFKKQIHPKWSEVGQGDCFFSNRTIHFILEVNCRLLQRRFDHDHSAHSPSRSSEATTAFLFVGFSFFLLFSTNVCFRSPKPTIMYSCSLHTVASRPLPSEKTHVPLPASHPAASLCSDFQLSQPRKKKKKKRVGGESDARARFF